eukprot:6182257-Pleurochrysis_carterae.AAC.2
MVRGRRSRRIAAPRHVLSRGMDQLVRCRGRERSASRHRQLVPTLLPVQRHTTGTRHTGTVLKLRQHLAGTYRYPWLYVSRS